MKISITYRFIASLLSLTIVFSVVSPVLGFAGIMEHCAEMMEMDESSHHEEHSMADMNYMDMAMDECCLVDDVYSGQHAIEHCETSIDCNCELEVNAVENSALIAQQLKLPKIDSECVILITSEATIQRIPPPLWYSSSYSPPLLFLANESFLI